MLDGATHLITERGDHGSVAYDCRFARNLNALLNSNGWAFLPISRLSTTAAIITTLSISCSSGIRHASFFILYHR